MFWRKYSLKRGESDSRDLRFEHSNVVNVPKILETKIIKEENLEYQEVNSNNSNA